jgi:hypothetical protein
MRIWNRVLILCLLVAAAYQPTASQTARRTTAARPTPSLAASLPPSDTVALVKVRRLLDEALPSMLASSPAKLAEVNARISNFKTRTGLDPRALDELALGLGYEYLPSGKMKVTTVGLAQGTFNSTSLVAAGRAAAAGKYREEKYQGKTIHVFTLDEQLRLLGVIDLKIKEFAVAPLNANTLALGDVKRVRSAIDASKGSKRANAELISLASQNANAIVGFGGNVSPAMIAHLRIGNDAVAKDLASVRQIYGFVGMTERDVEVLAAARTADPNSARSLGATVEGLTAFAGLFANRLPAARAALARSALGNLKVTVQGNDLQLRTAVAQAEVGPVVSGL